jgi:hypothetical protein
MHDMSCPVPNKMASSIIICPQKFVSEAKNVQTFFHPKRNHQKVFIKLVLQSQ